MVEMGLGLPTCLKQQKTRQHVENSGCQHTEHQATKESDPRETENTRGEPCDEPIFLHQVSRP